MSISPGTIIFPFPLGRDLSCFCLFFVFLFLILTFILLFYFVLFLTFRAPLPCSFSLSCYRYSCSPFPVLHAQGCPVSVLSLLSPPVLFVLVLGTGVASCQLRYWRNYCYWYCLCSCHCYEPQTTTLRPLHPQVHLPIRLTSSASSP